MPSHIQDDLRRGVFDLLFEENRSAVFSYFLGQLVSREDAKDQTQEVFTRAWSRVDEVAKINVKMRRFWLFSVAKNVLTDFRRRAKVRESAHEKLKEQSARTSPEKMEGLNPSRLDVAMLDLAISSLPDERRIILTMTVIGEMTSTEIGHVLGRPAGTIRSELYEARKELRKAIDR